MPIDQWWVSDEEVDVQKCIEKLKKGTSQEQKEAAFALSDAKESFQDISKAVPALLKVLTEETEAAIGASYAIRYFVADSLTHKNAIPKEI